MKILNIRILSIILLAIFYSCSSSGGDDDTPPPTGGTDDDPVIPDPSAATLLFPEDDTECNTGVIDGTNNDLSTVTFEWNASNNTDSYTVTVTNLNTNSSVSANATTNSADITILRGAPFSWSVVSRAQGTTATATSEVFRFYNEGPGVENYAPFPAEAIAPIRGANFDAATTTVTLEWSGSDVDDDIENYEVFFDTTQDPTTSLGTTSDTSIADVAVTSGNTYYWVVHTTDSASNVSTSEIFEFRVN